MQPLYTIGYEGLTLVAFIRVLREHKIERVIDVRRNPISRKQGFSKTALSNALAQEDISYSHLIDLGTPKELRDALKLGMDYEEFFEEVGEYIDGQSEAINTALDLALTQVCVLLCFEHSPLECHRSVVATEIVRRSNLELTVEHI